MKASSRPSARAAFTSCALAARIVFSRPTSSWAAASSARFLAAVEARASSRPAARADSPMACTRAFRSADAFRSLGMSRGFTHDGSYRDAEGQLHYGRPRISGLDAFNHAIDRMGPQELAVEGRRRVLACGTAQTLHPVRRDEAARALPRGDRHEEAQLLGERPEEKWQRLALGLQRGDHAHHPPGVAAVDRLDQRVALETRDVGHRFADRFQCDLALGQEERELLDLLLRREEVALDAIGEPLEGLDGCALALAREAFGEPVGKLVARDRLRLHRDTGALQSGEPPRLDLLPVALRRDHEAERVRGGRRAPGREARAALGARLARGEPKATQALRASAGQHARS